MLAPLFVQETVSTSFAACAASMAVLAKAEQKKTVKSANAISLKLTMFQRGEQ
jgi:hypothetical protein